MIHAFLHGLESVFAWLVEASWQASVLVALVLLLQVLLHSRLNPRWHHALWLLVVARLILPALPESALSVFQFTPHPPPAIAETVTEPIFAPSPQIQAPVPSLPALAPPPAPAYPFSLCTLLALVWLAGASGLLLLTWQVNRRFARHVAEAPAVSDPGLMELADSARSELGLHRLPRLIESAQVQIPAIMGLFRPTLILPKDVRARFSDAELRFIFLHEFAHLKRGDLFLQWLIALLQILHWFNPVLWYAFRRMRIDREPATDALVLSRTGEEQKESYGHVLLKLLEHYHTRHSLPTLVGILEDKDQFKRRFSLIAKFTRGAYGWSLLGTLLIVILSVVCLTRSKNAGNLRATEANPSKPLTATTASMSEAEANSKGIAALVNGVPIYWSSPIDDSVPESVIRSKLTGELLKQRLAEIRYFRREQHIDRELAIQGAEAEGYHTPQSVIDGRVNFGVKGFHGDKAAFIENLRRNGLTLQQFIDWNRGDDEWEHELSKHVNAPVAAFVRDHDGSIETQEFIQSERNRIENDWRRSERDHAVIQLFDDPEYPGARPPDFFAVDSVAAAPPLVAAAKEGNVSEVTRLLTQGTDPNATGDQGQTPLMAAVGENGTNSAADFYGVCEALLEHGAKASAADVLTVAASKNQKLIQLLQQNKALPISDLAYAVLENRPMDEIVKIEEKEAKEKKGLPSGLPDFIQVPTFIHPTAGSFSVLDRQLPFDEISDLSILDDASLPLPVAALMGDLPAIELLVQNGANPNAIPWTNPPNPWLSVSPLSLAVIAGHDDVVGYLLQHGAKAHINDIACAMRGWRSASSSQEHYENTVRLLIAAGALKNITEEQTAFLFESSFQNPEGNLGIVTLLLDAGLNPNARSNGKTVIDLTKTQIDLETKYNPEWETKYHFQRNTKPLLELLEAADKGASTNTNTSSPPVTLITPTTSASPAFKLPPGPTAAEMKAVEDSQTPLMKALHNHQYDQARALLAQGADCNATDKMGKGALATLIDDSENAGRFPIDILQTILARTRDPNPPVPLEFCTPPMSDPLLEVALMSAAYSNGPERLEDDRKVVKLLLAHGARFAGMSANVQALLQAAALDDLPTLQQLVAKGASPSAADDDGWTPLLVSVALDHQDAANWLIDHGANVGAITRRGAEDPLLYATAHGDDALVEKLIAKGAKPVLRGGDLWRAIDRNDQRLFDDLINAGADPRQEAQTHGSAGGKSWRQIDSDPLFTCITKGETAMALTLIAKGVDPEPANVFTNRNFAYWAVYHDRPQILQALLDHGANPLLKDDAGETPLSLAQKSHPDLVPMLQAAAKKVTLKSDAGTQPHEAISDAGNSTAQAKETDPDAWTIHDLKVSDMPLTELAQRLTAMTRAEDPQGIGARIDVKVPPGEAPLKITYGYPPYTGDLGNLLYHLAALYPLQYELQVASRDPAVQQAPITLIQLPAAEAALNKKAGRTKIDLDFSGTNFITALNAVQSQAATKGFHFEINTDALKGLSLPPVTLKARNWSVQHAMLSLCYLAGLVAQPLESSAGYGFRPGTETELHDRTCICFGIATAFYKADDKSAKANSTASLAQPGGEKRTWGPSEILPAYPWVYRGKEMSPTGGTIGTQFSYHHKPGDPAGFVVPVEGAPYLETSFKTFVVDKTHIRATITLRLKKTDGTVLRELTGETTAPSGAILSLVVHGVPLRLDTPDDPTTKSDLYVFAQAGYVDNGKRETDIEPQSLELVSPSDIIQKVEMSDTGA